MTDLEQSAQRESDFPRLSEAFHADGASPAAPRLSWFLASTAGVALATAAVAAVDPNRPGHYPVCPFLTISGFYCPACGGLRAVHDLAHGDVVGALARNPLVVLAVPFLVFAWVCWGLRALGFRAPQPLLLSLRAVLALVGVAIIFWVLRNVPGWTWLSPA